MQYTDRNTTKGDRYIWRLIRQKTVLINARINTRVRLFYLQKRTESDRIVIGGMDDENDTKKRIVSSFFRKFNFAVQ